MARPPKLDDGEILDRAMRTFWRNGLTATSIRDLELELGLKAPAIYRRFEHKDDLTRAVLDHYVDRVVRPRISRHLTGIGDPVANVRAFLESAVRPSRRGEPLLGCLLTVAALEATQLGPEHTAIMAGGHDEIEQALHAELTRAEDAGQLSDGFDAEAATAVVTLAFQGLMVLARAGQPATRLQRRIHLLLDAIAPHHM